MKKKKLKKIAVSAAVCTALTTAMALPASAATVSDGIKADITANAQTSTTAKVNAQVKNANYYAIKGINYKVSVSDNAELTGETAKTDVNLGSEEDDTLTLSLTLKNQEKSGENSSEESSKNESSKQESSKSNPTVKPTDTNHTKKTTTSTKAQTVDKSTIKTEPVPSEQLPLWAVRLWQQLCLRLPSKEKTNG